MTFSFLKNKNYYSIRRELEIVKKQFFLDASIGGNSKSIWLVGYTKGGVGLEGIERFLQGKKISASIGHGEADIIEVVISLD